MRMMQSYLSHLECGWCGKTYDFREILNLCPACGKPLLPRYDLDAAKANFTPERLKNRPKSLWRYGEMLPVQGESFRYTLGEGFTPMLPVSRLGKALGLSQLYAKDEGINPTGSFKARGLVMAVSRAAELGVKALAIPSAGNAGSAAAAYGARAGLPVYVYLPQDVPPAFLAEIKALGAEITLVDGLITDCAKLVRQGADEGRWFDLSTLKEPYRVEGKKTMGYEIAEQMGWQLPDVIVYPTGGGTGIVGIWKAFAEMEALGWIGSKRPRMISVQSAGCAPIVRAYEQGVELAEMWQNAATIADGLRVPAAVGDFLILRAVRESGGTALAVSDDEIRAAQIEIGRSEGIFVAPEAAATAAALPHLLAAGKIQADERIVLLITGNGLKYMHLLA
ncbi:MAG: putative threonine synthase [Chloroflexi bacterium OLB15]|nr:MAG: putative threonine synthase [Chloroflexi bacterium OLB15]